MKILISSIARVIQNKENCMLLSVIAGSGSTPQGAGAKMAVFADGSSIGTIGGGALEYKSQQMAVEALQKKQSYTMEFKLHPNQVADLGMVCGGDVEARNDFNKAKGEQKKRPLQRALFVVHCT